LATAEARVRELEGKLRLSRKPRAVPEQPEVLSGLTDLWGLETNPDDGAAAEAATVDSSMVEPVAPETDSDNLQLINGIGPAYERRLKQAGIKTYADLASCAPEDLREIAGIKSRPLSAPEEWITQAQTLSEA
jgi:hypothetical protein